jgi:mono/diheme cytochrome c family protein
MKRYLTALAFGSVLLAGSLSWAQNQKEIEKTDVRNSHRYSELTKAPERARLRPNPLQDDPEAIAAGRILFEDHCEECHGSSGERGKHGPNLRVPEVQNATSGTLFWLLSGGVVRKGMPVWSKLPEAQRWQLVRYLKSLGINEIPTVGINPSPR